MVNQGNKELTLITAQTTIRDFLENWLVRIELSIRPNTLHQYTKIVQDRIVPMLGAISLEDLQPEHVQNLYVARSKLGDGPRTVRMTHAVLHAALEHALKLGVIDRNPSEATILPKWEPKEITILDKCQVSQMFNAGKGHRHEALFYLAVTTGMRQGELLGLKWADLDWVNRTIYVIRQLKRDLFRGGTYFAPPKTKYGQRRVVVGSKALVKLREHQEKQQIERKLADDKWEDNDLIFPNKNGRPMDARSLLRNFKRLLKNAGLPEIRFHDLRHTAASLMLNNGVDVLIVSRRLGHSKPSVTLNIYGHLMPGMQQKAADLMDELLTPVELETTV